MAALGTAELYELPRAIPGQLLLFEPPARSSTFDGGPAVVAVDQLTIAACREDDPPCARCGGPRDQQGYPDCSHCYRTTHPERSTTP